MTNTLQIDDQFVVELDAIRQNLETTAGEDGLHHLRKIQIWAWLCGIAGLVSAGIISNLITAFLISQYRFTS